jgi:hypothetical protein
MWRHKLPFRRAAAFSIVGYAVTDNMGPGRFPGAKLKS